MKRMGEVMVRQAIRDHETWLETNGERGKRADFSKKLLIGTDFISRILDHAIFDEATLINCSFSDAKLNEASFKKATLKDCSFIETSAEKIDFTNATVTGCIFDFSNMNEASFKNAIADYSSFRYTRLINTTFDEASLIKTNFKCAIATGASFFAAKINWANLNEACFVNAVMCEASLHHAYMLDSNFEGADLYGVAWPIDSGSVGVCVDMNIVKQFLAHIAGFNVEIDKDNEFIELLQIIKKYIKNSKYAEELKISSFINYIDTAKTNETLEEIEDTEDEELDDYFYIKPYDDDLYENLDEELDGIVFDKKEKNDDDFSHDPEEIKL